MTDPGPEAYPRGAPLTDPAHEPDPATAALAPAPSTEPEAEPSTEPDAVPERPPRPFVERLGLAAVALFVGGLFTLMAGAAWVGDEGFLAVMAGLGGVMTFWAGLSSLRRG